MDYIDYNLSIHPLQGFWIRCGRRPYSPPAFDAAPDPPEQAQRVEGGERKWNIKNILIALAILVIQDC